MTEDLFRCICSLDPERTATIAGEAMPLCARCAGLLFGAACTLVFVFARRRPLGDPVRGWFLYSWIVVVVTPASVIVDLWTPVGVGLRYGLGALTGHGLVLLLAPVFARRVLAVETRSWSRGSGLGALLVGVGSLFSLSAARALGGDAISPVAGVGLIVFAVMAVALVLRVLVRPAAPTWVVWLVSPIGAGLALALGRWLRD